MLAKHVNIISEIHDNFPKCKNSVLYAPYNIPNGANTSIAITDTIINLLIIVGNILNNVFVDKPNAVGKKLNIFRIPANTKSKPNKNI